MNAFSHTDMLIYWIHVKYNMAGIPKLSEIKKLREELSLSQRELAKLCDIQPSFLNMIENGHSDPSYKVLVRIFQILDAEAENKRGKLTSAKHICTRNIITAKKTDYVEDIIKIMKTKNISQIPVIESNCIGMVTENSFVKFIRENGAEKLVMAKVKDAMEIPPPSLDVDAKITKNILDLLYDSRCILVTDKGKLYGIITKIDAIRSLMK